MMKDLYNYCIRVVRLVDGDTILAIIDCGFHINVREFIRLYDVNTPEVRGVKFDPEGKWASLYTDLWLRSQEHLWTDDRTVDFDAFKAGIVLNDYRNDLYVDSRKYDAREKYGRVLGVIYRGDDPVSLNEALLALGYPAYRA
jgi:endonuclease YncB( thermonuclease family)